jgi:hypothetical protein
MTRTSMSLGAALLLALGACTTTRPSPLPLDGLVEETWLTPSIVRLDAGPDLRDPGKFHALALYRAAELALANGAPRFRIPSVPGDEMPGSVPATRSLTIMLVGSSDPAYLSAIDARLVHERVATEAVAAAGQRVPVDLVAR